MGFNIFKNDYLAIVDGDGFKTTKETVDFIVDNYVSSVAVPGLVIAGEPLLIEAMKLAVQEVFDSGAPPTAIETGLSAAIVAYWVPAIFTGGFATLPALTMPGFPGAPTVGNIPAQADTAEEFVDGLIGMFEMHLSTVIFGHVSSTPLTGPTSPIYGGQVP
jgi:hypothetical protein